MDSQLAFVTNAYRVAEDTRPAIKSQYVSTARIVSFNTNLDVDGAIRRVQEELEAGDTTRVFELVLEQVLLPDNFIGGPPSFKLYSPADGLDGETFTAFEVSEVNLKLGTSTVRVR
jgi:hypothetical protein